MVTTDLYGKPFQLKFVRPGQMLLFANILCDPPLGRATVIPHHQHAVKFTVLLESSKSFPEQGWEVVLWHNAHQNREWRELPLQLSVAADRPLAVNSKSQAKVYRRYFSISLPRPACIEDPVQFTLKFRCASDDTWKWMNDQSNFTDGILYFQPQNSPNELRDYLRDYSSDISIESVSSEAPDTQLWSIASVVKAAVDEVSGFTDVSLGTPRSFTRWFSLVRIWNPWLAPRHGQGNFAPTEDAVLCSFLRWDGLHLVLLAVSGIDDVLTVLKPDGHGNVVIHARNDNPEPKEARVLAAVGKTFETANAAVMYHARKLVGGIRMSDELEAEMKASIENDVRTEWMENWYDGLTYCTWNGLGQDLNEQKIFDALDILKANNIKITNLIIDDNWQSLDYHGESQFKRGMTEFDANVEGFPQGLKHAVTQIRDSHPDIQHIAVWHAMLGYWGGISPTGTLAKSYTTRVVRKHKGITGDEMTVIDPLDVHRFYNDFYRFLLSCGIDSVKTDAQFFLDLLSSAEDRRDLMDTYQDAWTINSLRYFSIKAISCMSQTPQIIFHTQLPANKPRLMVRNSDDFFPEIPSSHPWHIFTNAHNSLLTSHLNILPDWDMFQTSHPYSSFHAAGRCVSGGPIYFTDEPGKHDLDLIKQMTARTTRGKTVILRPSVIGKTVGVYTAYEEETLLKVGTYTGGKSSGTGILGLFNVSRRPLSEFVNLNSFPGVEVDQEYIVRSHTTGEISNPLQLEDDSAVVSLEIQVKGYEILSAYPLRAFTLKGSSGLRHESTKVAVLGLLGKMTGAAAVVATEMRIDENGRLRIRTTLKALGVLGIAISTLRERSVADDVMVMMGGKGVPLHAVSVGGEGAVLEIDVERAWEELGLEVGWGNEVGVEVFVR